MNKKTYQRIRDLREDRDWTQKKVADELGLWLNTYRSYETGLREPPFYITIEIAKLYGVSLDYIAGLIDVPEKLKR